MKTLLVVGLLFFALVLLGIKEVKRETEAEAQYYREHPLTAAQVSANRHFSTCWKFKHMPESVWTESQRLSMLEQEGCHSKVSDDPRMSEASYPWNEHAPHPWKY
jgi:hypothetical protein